MWNFHKKINRVEPISRKYVNCTYESQRIIFNNTYIKPGRISSVTITVITQILFIATLELTKKRQIYFAVK